MTINRYSSHEYIVFTLKPVHPESQYNPVHCSEDKGCKESCSITILFCPCFISAPPYFCFIFSRFIRFWMSRIWMDKNSIQNNFLFYFQTTQLSCLCKCTIFLFLCIYQYFFSEWSDWGTVWYVLRKTKKFSERNYINTLSHKFKVEKNMSLL